MEQGLDGEDENYLVRLKNIQNENLKFETTLYKEKAGKNNIKKFKDL